MLHPSVLKKRLEMFLKVFAAVISPKQLYLHQQLFDFYTSILARSETNIVKVAYDCILGYKPPYLMPVRENVRRLLDDKKIRDELVVFDPSMGGDGVRSSRSSAAVDEGQLGVSHVTFITTPLFYFLFLSTAYKRLSCIRLLPFLSCIFSTFIPSLLHPYLCLFFVPLTCFTTSRTLDHLTSPHSIQHSSIISISPVYRTSSLLFLFRSSTPHIVKSSYL